MGKKNHKKLGQFEVPALRNAAKTLLANVRFTAVDEPVKTIVVTSSVPDEGKTTVSSNLACAMASSGRRVLIMDCDMRRRDLGAMLELHPKFGVYAVISGSVPVDEAISPTRYKNLFFMDCEPNIPSPPDILSTRRFEALLESLRDKFDYVIIDTPPLGAFVDAAVVASIADGVMLVVRQGSAKKKAINDSIQQLQAANARILGAVMTFTEDADSDYYYAYYNQEGKRVDRKQQSQQPLIAVSRDMVSDDVDVWARKAGITSRGAAGMHGKSAGNGAAGAGNGNGAVDRQAQAGNGAAGANKGGNAQAGVKVNKAAKAAAAGNASAGNANAAQQNAAQSNNPRAAANNAANANNAAAGSPAANNAAAQNIANNPFPPGTFKPATDGLKGSKKARGKGLR